MPNCEQHENCHLVCDCEAGYYCQDLGHEGVWVHTEYHYRPVEDVHWEACPVTQVRHTQYRGMDVHEWDTFICFYPTEGYATYKEMDSLERSIIRAGLQSFLLYRPGKIFPGTARGAHDPCAIMQRTDEEYNYCLEAPDLAGLDAILDGLWADAMRMN